MIDHAVPAATVTDSPELDRFRESDGPDEVVPVPEGRFRGIGIARVTERQTYGPAISVGTILEDAALYRAIGLAPALTWLRDADGIIVGLALNTYEAK